jgi:molybdenum cofactor cytidylyltransferase
MTDLTFSAVLLAAGSSSRMQGGLKQLLPVPPAGLPMVRATALSLLAAGPAEVVVVTGHRGREVMAALGDLPVSFQPNPRHTQGQMTSVAAGLAALKVPCSAVMICLADMVLLQPRDYVQLAQRFAALPGNAILVPHHRGARGNPVIFSVSRVPEVLSGTINPGCRRLIEDHPADVVWHEADHERFTVDIDTPEDYERFCGRLQGLQQRAVV